MSALQAFTLKFGNLELQISPSAWTDGDLQSVKQIVEEAQKRISDDPTQELSATLQALNAVIDLFLQAAKPNHPDLTREQFEDLDIDDLVELPWRIAKAMAAAQKPPAAAPSIH